MNRAISLLRLTSIHPLLWMVIALSIATGYFLEVCLLLAIIFIHELGHAVAASFFSWRIKKITLLPFGGVAEMDEHGNRPLKEETIVVIAGPLQHVWMVAASYALFSTDVISEDLFNLFLHYNVMILVFNLFPVWPLDGGKLVFLLLSLKNSFPSAHRLTLLISFFGLTLFSILILLAAPSNLNVWVVIAFLFFSLYHEWKQRRFIFMRFLLERYYGKKSELQALKPIQANEQDLLIHVLEKFQRGCKHPIIVEAEGKEKGTLDENELLHAYFTEKRLTDKISDLLFSY
ncbi:M50 family metallopeptidase [Neobacillus sp. MM2021_6]|uniref:M50 family metallopeptidase n=1 Tax=Bacillaceae TaxID=186817 RepID=UPI00140B6B42|nr:MULTISPECIES: M50 family metallopeptidase [Bacillaceae]MBO0960727.1 M50 family metallopeptidase [Neobacillus sp. MM2021_6]NHC17351.1 stage IV sporulation protein FB [Bacillus sp. MM2020_4]